MNQVRRKLVVVRAEGPALETKEGGPGGGRDMAAGGVERGRRGGEERGRGGR